MLSKNTEKILAYLLKEQPELGININQIAKNTKISVGSAFKILKNLESQDILKKKQISNASHYKLNLDNEETRKLSELLLIKEKNNLKGYPKIYAEDIKKIDAHLIILFGSILEKNKFNDVDVLIITKTPKQTQEACYEISKTRTKPISPLIMKKIDFQEQIKTEILREIIKKGVVLKGEALLIKTIQNAEKQNRVVFEERNKNEKD